MLRKKTLYECRLCLEESTFAFSLFDENLADLVETLASVTISTNDNFPCTCCEKCLANLNIVLELQQRILRSDEILRARSAISEQISEDVEESDGDGAAVEVFKIECAADAEEADLETIELSSDEDVEYELDPAVANEDDASKDDSQTYFQVEFGKCEKEKNDSNGSSMLNMVLNFNDDLKQRIAEKRQLQRNLECVSCNLKFESYRTLHAHMIKHKSVGERRVVRKEYRPMNLECNECGEKLDNTRALQAHKGKHKLTRCSICDSNIRSDNFKRHFEMHSACKEICEICGKTAKNKESLRGHMFYQHRENPQVYKCEDCNREFRYRYKYTMHIRKAHTGQRDHQCKVCDKKFFTKFDLKKHVDMTHLRSRPYICQYCKRGYSSRYALKTHVRQHTLETPFRCDVCAAGFRQRVSLRTHLKSKHNIIDKPPIPCQLVNKRKLSDFKKDTKKETEIAVSEIVAEVEETHQNLDDT